MIPTISVPLAIVSERVAGNTGPTRERAWQTDPCHSKDDWREIVGVVGDTRDDGMDKDAPKSVYWPMLVAHFEGNDVDVRRFATYSIRSPRAGSQSLMNEMRRAVWSVDPNLPLSDVHTLDYLYRRSMARTSFTLVMLASQVEWLSCWVSWASTA